MNQQLNVSLDKKLVAHALCIVGIAAILFGAGMAIYSLFSLRPKLAGVTKQLKNTVTELDRTVDLLGGESRLASHSLNVLQSVGQIASLTPEILEHTRGILNEAGKASVATGKVANKTKKGIAGAVLPKPEIENTTADLKGMGYELQSMRKTVENLEPTATVLAKDAEMLGSAVAKSHEQLTATDGVLPNLNNDLKALNKSLDVADLPMQAALLGIGLSGLYFLFGAVSLTLGLALRKSQQL